MASADVRCNEFSVSLAIDDDYSPSEIRQILKNALKRSGIKKFDLVVSPKDPDEDELEEVGTRCSFNDYFTEMNKDINRCIHK